MKKIYNSLMDARVTEASYPLEFRQDEARKLGEYLKQRQSVNLIGMKRVGISNFLRFFINQKDIVPTYISTDQKHLFIPIDLNDLVEREIYPFWTLTLKRIVDASQDSSLPDNTKQKISSLFLASIQSQDLFVVIDSVRLALHYIAEKDVFPTLFFLRFDRFQDKFNPSLFDNLEGLRTSLNASLAYVFTSYRSLDYIFPMVKTSLSVFAQHMYVKPAIEEDMNAIYEVYKKRYDLHLQPEIEQALFTLVNGNVQYLQLAMIVLTEKKDVEIENKQDLLRLFLADERITLESEELWDSLSKDEKKDLVAIAKKQKATEIEKTRSKYLWDCGFIHTQGDTEKIFSPLLEDYLFHVEQEESKKNQIAHLTRKEHLLFTLLEANLGDICEREKIIEVVWPEYREFGVSDWAIDRLVARVRVKLRAQQSPYEIVTVRTRGYKLATVKN